MKVLSQKNNKKVFEDGDYIVKEISNYHSRNFDFDAYKTLQKRCPWFVKVHKFENECIVMDKVQGQPYYDWRNTIECSADRLYWLCVTWRYTVWKKYFENLKTQLVELKDQVFFHSDMVPGNVLIKEDNTPVIIDPNAVMWTPWDIYLQKLNEHHHIWWNEYVLWAHRNDLFPGAPWPIDWTRPGYRLD